MSHHRPTPSGKTERPQNRIDLYAEKVRFDGEWLSVKDLAERIQANIQSGEMKVAGLAAALEQLNTALENSCRLEVTLVISKDEYEQLKAEGGHDDRECVRKAIMAFIGYKVDKDSDAANPAKKKANDGREAKSVPPESEGPPRPDAPVRCIQCKSPLRPGDVGAGGTAECPVCSVISQQETGDSKETRYKDHFLG